MGRVEGKVAFITGAARGQGRSHALRLAEEGADIIAVDLCEPVKTAPYGMPTPDDLAETAKLVEDFDRRIVTRQADVRDLGQLQATVQAGVSELGHIDIVCANAGIASFAPALEMDEVLWQEMIDINLTGVWKTIRAAVPPMVERGQGGAIIITSSVAGLFGFPNLAAYSSAKHGVIGLMRTLAQELAPHMIRVNTVNPTTVDTPMIMSDAFYGLIRPDLAKPGRDDMAEAFTGLNCLPIPWVDPVDISNAVLWLASDEARYVTGVALPVDAGFCQKVGGAPVGLAGVAAVADDLAARRAELAAQIVGRSREIDLVLAAVSAGRDLLLEGPPGTSKSTILRAITTSWGIPLLFVEGNAELTPAKLIGHHNPARVLREDYSADNFVPGPLVAAMQRGGFLYIEELNRAPEDTLNALLTAMAEREVEVPRVGRFEALPTFRVVASMNPFDNVGTMRISASFYDRLCRLAVGYQTAGEDEAIVALRTGCEEPRLVTDAVALTRATRSHPDVRQGSSVRGAIDLVAVTRSLREVRGAVDGDGHAELVLDAAFVALSARVTLDETSHLTPEDVIRQLWEDHFVLRPRRAAPGGQATALPNPI